MDLKNRLLAWLNGLSLTDKLILGAAVLLLLLGLIAGVAALFKPDIFRTPEAVVEIREQAAEATQAAKVEQQEAIKEVEKEHARQRRSLQLESAKKNKELQSKPMAVSSYLSRAIVAARDARIRTASTAEVRDNVR